MTVIKSMKLVLGIKRTEQDCLFYQISGIGDLEVEGQSFLEAYSEP